MNKLPHIQILNSKNKDIEFSHDKFFETIFHTHLNKMFDIQNRISSLDDFYKIPEKLNLKNISKKIKDFNLTKYGKKFLKNEIFFLDYIIGILGTEQRKYIFLTVMSNAFLIPMPFFVRKFLESLKRNDEDSLKEIYYSGSILILCYFLVKAFKFWSLYWDYYSETESKIAVQVRKNY